VESTYYNKENRNAGKTHKIHRIRKIRACFSEIPTGKIGIFFGLPPFEKLGSNTLFINYSILYYSTVIQMTV
jgi:hypothetical protein